jgi:penicillin-binding protein 2
MALRVAVLGGVALVIFAVLFLRLWTLQILSGDHYRRQANDNQLRTAPIEAPRGPILDREGRLLVTNVPTTAVLLSPSDLPKGTGRDTELRRLSLLLHVPLPEIQAKIRARRDDPLTPVKLKVAVHDEQVDYLQEHSTEFPGVDVVDSYLRHYNTQALAAQVLGYTREISAEQLKALRKERGTCNQPYRGGDEIGQAGVEAGYDRYLRGCAGAEETTVNSLGQKTRSYQVTSPAVPGKAIRLTIDIALQRSAERAIRYGIDLAQQNGEWAANGGSIVALDPNTGEVLAMASYPTYKPSVFVGRTDAKKLAPVLDQKVAAEKNFPALNRATQGLYPAGSTFKPVTALAAMEEHLISPYQTLPCTGEFVVKGRTGRDQVFKNWDPSVNEPMNLPTAIAYSCDSYFYELGYWFFGLPPERGHPLQNWAARFGFGAPTGIDIGPESKGLLPTPEWRQQTYTKKTDPCCWEIDRLWKPGDSIQLAIGQKDLLVTPLQMARFYALIANGGKLVTPHVVADVEEPRTNGHASKVLRRFDSPPPQDVGVDPAALQVVKDGLYQAAHASYGTSTGVFGSFPIDVCGKTGTAEKVVHLKGYTGLKDQSWWVGYAPCDKPKIVVAALIENGGHGGSAAAPAAAQVFAQYFHVPAPQLGYIHSD